ncbi:hypothetical protein PG989_010214 [Apiospora arundinis]
MRRRIPPRTPPTPPSPPVRPPRPPLPPLPPDLALRPAAPATPATPATGSCGAAVGRGILTAVTVVVHADGGRARHSQACWISFSLQMSGRQTGLRPYLGSLARLPKPKGKPVGIGGMSSPAETPAPAPEPWPPPTMGPALAWTLALMAVLRQVRRFWEVTVVVVVSV